MTEATFQQQLQRMKTRWTRAFDPEFSKLVASELAPLPDNVVIDAVNQLIGSRTPSQPPLIQDFRVIRLGYLRRQGEMITQGAADALNWPEGSLRRALDANPDWRGCKTFNEAVEVERLRIRLEKLK